MSRSDSRKALQFIAPSTAPSQVMRVLVCTLVVCAILVASCQGAEWNASDSEPVQTPSLPQPQSVPRSPRASAEDPMLTESNRLLTYPQGVERAQALIQFVALTILGTKPETVGGRSGQEDAPTDEDRWLCDRWRLVADERTGRTETQFIVYENEQNPGERVLAFRGADLTEGENILTGLMIQPTDCHWLDGGNQDCGSIHRGFDRAYRDARERVMEAVRGATSIHITGHSLGGALALIATMDLKSSGLPVTSTYVFGSPKIGNRQFEDAFNRVLDGPDPSGPDEVDHVRSVNACGADKMDIITTLPDEFFWFDYAYGPAERFIRWQELQGETDPGQCALVSRTRLHRRTRYIDATREAYEQQQRNFGRDPSECADVSGMLG